MTRTRLLLCLLAGLAFGDFIVRAVVPAYAYDKNDFSDPYCASWLWRHGQNPYDVGLATRVNHDLARTDVRIVPVYPLTAYLLISPLSLLPWKLANLLWALLGVAAVSSLAYMLPRIAGLSFAEDHAWFLAACVLCSAPLHSSLHVANSAAIAIGLGVLAIYFAENRSVWAGVVLALAVCLKPQLGIWILIFHVARRQWRLVAPCVTLSVAISGAALIRIPESLTALLAVYRSNLHFWFKPGGMNDFTVANAFHFQLVNAQVVLYPLVHNILTANVLAWVLFGIGICVWGWTMLRRPPCPNLLALSSLIALGLIPVYHRSYDSAVLLLALAWLLHRRGEQLRRVSGAALLALLVLLTPVDLAIRFLKLHLPTSVLGAWWWNLVVVDHGAWLALLVNAILLYSLWITSRDGIPESTPASTTDPPASCRAFGQAALVGFASSAPSIGES